MSYQILPLPADDFRHLYGLSDAALEAFGARAYPVDAPTGFPCRVSIADAKVGDRMILVNYEHLPVDSAYRSRHAVYVTDGAETGAPIVDEIPAYLGRRLLSVRAFDDAGMMQAADVVEGWEAAPLFETYLALPGVAYLHVHTARRGCYLARIERA